MNISEYAYKMYLDGMKDEEIVMKLTEETFKCKTEKSTRTEDIKLHVDFWVLTEEGKKYGIDVKGVRKHNRNDAYPDDSIHWIEVKNVKGNPGWIYGESVYIAFMTNKSVLFVPTKKLIPFIESKIKGKALTYFNPRQCYQPYQRKGRSDVVIKVPTNDLRLLSKHEVYFREDKRDEILELINETT